MNMKTVIALQEAGVDTEGALNRFCGNAALYEKFLLKFPADENFAKIAPAIEAGDMEEALRAAHTLKGVSGNLGMQRLYEACSAMVALIRAGENEKAADSYGPLATAYTEVCAAVSCAEEA